MRGWLKSHPLLRDVLLWSIPALLVGLVLRLLFLHASPYAFWGADSRSFMGFTNGVLTDFYFSINEKRRYLYPLFLFPISLLPGGTLLWLGWIQAALGLASILPLAYAVRRVFRLWPWLILPVTVLYAGMPVFLWFEHELIAESVFFQAMVWTMGGWVAWTGQANPLRARQLWWWFWVPLAILMLTKPAGKFLWPGILLALVVVAAWRVLRWREGISLLALIAAGMTVGSDNQASWLLYTTSFPLTPIDTPAHADIKAELRPLIVAKRERLDWYDEEDDEVHDLLRNPESRPEFTRLNALTKQERDRVYKSLALEAIRAHPVLFLRIALQRLAGSCNQADFKTVRFQPDYHANYLHKIYYHGREEKSMMKIVFGIPRNAPYPSYEELKARVSPHPDAFSTRFLLDYANAYQKWGDLVSRPSGQQTILSDMRLTILGWCVLAGAVLSLFGPYRRALGVWTVTFAGYLCAVYLVGVEHHRYFALTCPFILLLLALLPDALFRAVRVFLLAKRGLGGSA